MKTSNKNTLEKKLSKLTVSKTSIAYRFVKEVISGKKEIRPCHTSGSGRYISNQDHSFATMQLLDSLGVEYIFSNDSKRGGLTGNLITITTKISQ